MKGKKEPNENILNDEESKLALKKKLENAGNVLKRTEEGIGKIFHTKKAVDIHSDITGSFFVGIVMCLSSPTLPASWFATVGYLKSYGLLNSSFFTGILLGFGVLIGTTFWFYLMTKLIFKHAEKFNPKFMKKLNFATGIFLILLGVFFFIKITFSQFN